MKNKFLIPISVFLSLFLFSCHNATEPPPMADEPVLLTGKIAFSASTPDSVFIYTINPDGTGLKKITTSAYSNNPVWSPDGSQIAFTGSSTHSFFTAIYLMNADGSNIHLLPVQPESLADGHSPNWSQDGNKIVYTHFGEANAFGFDYTVIVSLIDGRVLNLKNDDDAVMDYTPKWSPDGKKIIFSSNRDYFKTNEYANTDLYIVDADGQNVKRLTKNGNIAYYLWYPSDQSIIFLALTISNGINEYRTFRIDTSGNILQDLGTYQLGILSNVIVILSSDSKRLAISSDGEIQLLDIRSKAIQKIHVTNISGLKYYPVSWSVDDKELLVRSVTVMLQGKSYN